MNIITAKTRSWYQTKPPLGSQLNFSHPLAQGMVGCWLMNERGGSSVKESMLGTIGITDSGFGDYLYWVKKKDSIYLRDDASQSYLRYSYAAGFLNSYPFTMVALVQPNTTTDANVMFMGDGTASNQYFCLTMGAGPPKLFAITARNTTEFTNAGSKAADYNFHLVVGVFASGTSRKLYVDGIFQIEATDNVGIVTDMNRIQFGPRGDSTPTIPLSGYIKSAWLYKRALSPSEITSLYEAPYQMVAGPRNRLISYGLGGEAPTQPSLGYSAATCQIYMS